MPHRKAPHEKVRMLAPCQTADRGTTFAKPQVAGVQRMNVIFPSQSYSKNAVTAPSGVM
jgi:hypothetical protein